MMYTAQMMRALFLTVVTVITFSFAANGQQKIVGKVVDAVTKQPVKQALITVEGTAIGTTTNVMGFFEVKVDTTNTLTIEHPGYINGRIRITSMKNIKVSLVKKTDAEKKAGNP
jgi:CarboxypepD_reg-like domain